MVCSGFCRQSSEPLRRQAAASISQSCGVDFWDGGQGDLRRARKTQRWERRFITKGWFRIYQQEGFQHFSLCFPENAALKMASITDALLDWLKETWTKKHVMKIWSQKPTTWAICPTSQCLNKHAGSILWLWVNKTCTYISLKWKWNIYECKWNIFLWLFLLRASAMMACRRHATLHTLAAQCCVAGILPVVWKNKQYTFGKIGKT